MRKSVCSRWPCVVFCLVAFSACTPGTGSHTNKNDAGRPITDAATLDGDIQDATDPCAEPAEGAPPSDVFCTGLYENGDSSQHAPSAMPYRPGVTFWSDGAEKQRYLSIPPSTQIDTSDLDSWKFPIGTKAWKEFRVDGALVETRLLWKRGEGSWVSGTYIWDENARTATLNASRKATLLANGYEIPAARDCGKCHHGGADQLLGVEAIALALPRAEGVTLASLVAANALSVPPAITSIALPEDATGKAAEALGYLHVNCGMACHSSRGLGEETQLRLRLRADEIWPTAGSAPTPVALTDLYLATFQQPPTTASVAQQFPGAQRILPGSHEESLLWLLSHRRGNYQMPPLVSHQVDEVGTEKLAEWIDALAAP